MLTRREKGRREGQKVPYHVMEEQIQFGRWDLVWIFVFSLLHVYRAVRDISKSLYFTDGIAYRTYVFQFYFLLL